MPYFDETTEGVAQTNAIAVEVALAWSEVAVLPSLTELVEPHVKIEGDSRIFDLYFVSEMPSPFGVFAGIHGHLSENGQLEYLWMRLRRKYKEETPKDILEISEALGGYPAGLTNFFDSLPPQTRLCEANIDLAIPQKWKWRSRLRPRELPEIAVRFKKAYEIVGLIDEEGTEIDIRLSQETGTAFEVETKTELLLDINCFQRACEIGWSKVEHFIEKS